jgi:TonB family protein
MSYKCLLFCPDERTARLVTQVLSELEFTVELSNEPFATVKKLAEERFDALVADIQDEQDAALLFKSARNSSLNHSSLAVAVVEGQSGVAKAFRIGANLVLTKPINIEQSKSTLRVARGLLRKNEAKPASGLVSGRPAGPASVAGAAWPAANVSSPTQALPTQTLPTQALTPVPASAPPAGSGVFSAVASTPSASSPAGSSNGFTLLETEREETPAPDPTEAAFLESVANKASRSGHSLIPSWGRTREVAGSTGHAAATAPARSKPNNELKFSIPLATQEAIMPNNSAAASFEPASVPTFSSYGQESIGSGSEKRILKKVALVVILGVASYFAWQRLQLSQYLPGLQTGLTQSSSKSTKTPTVSESKSVPAPVPANVPDISSENDSEGKSAHSAAESKPSGAVYKSQLETIEVKDSPTSEEPKITVVPKPLVVKTTGSGPGKKQTQITPPSLALPLASALATPAPGASQPALPNLIATNTTVPHPAPHTVRLSQGLSQGLVIKKVAPVYPPVALQLRKEGAVELTATISREGAITGVKVASGDPVLGKAAADAVRQWKYRPYLLNGEPVEIETQITVNFRLPH